MEYDTKDRTLADQLPEISYDLKVLATRVDDIVKELDRKVTSRREIVKARSYK